jgi:hypothetical protein
MAKKYNVLWLAAIMLVAPNIVNAQEENVDAAVEKKLPIGVDLYLTNNVGAGTVSKAYKQDPYVASSLYVYPTLKFGPFWGERESKTHVELNGNLEWLGQNNPINGSFGKKLSLGDVKIRSELKKALYSNDIGLSLTPALKIEAPASKASRDSNRVIGVGGYVTTTWAKWGFFATYKPVFLAYAYSSPYKSGDCADDALVEDKLSNGSCKASGRQTMMLLKNGFFTGYGYGGHTLTLGFRSYHSFLRAANKGEKPESVASSGVMEATLGVVEYAYNLPVAVPTTLIFGISGYQAPYDAANGFRVPFFNFDEPAKNQTEAYVAVNVSI